jgi:hypothetical protein
METTFTWGSAGTDGTHMNLRDRGAPAGFSGLAAPLMVASMRKADRSDLARLKWLLEAASGPRTGG